jgi:Fe-S-cluster containining protein
MIITQTYEQMKPEQKICQKCGKCCQKNSPALHEQDLPLIANGHIARNQLITYRKGELVYDNVAGLLIKLNQEIIKLAMNNNCIFYLPDTRKCSIYNYRPLECRTQLCSDPVPFKKMYQMNRLTRKDIISDDSPLLELIEYHEKNCSLNDLPQSSNDLTATQQENLKNMIQFEYHFRYTLFQQTGMQQSDMNFLLGRPVEKLLKQSGVK